MNDQLDPEVLDIIANELEITVPDFKKDEVLPYMKEHGLNDPYTAYRGLMGIQTEAPAPPPEETTKDNMKEKIGAIIHKQETVDFNDVLANVKNNLNLSAKKVQDYKDNVR